VDRTDVRTREVRTPSARGETWAVARALFHIAYWSVLAISAEAHGAKQPGVAAALSSPFERGFQDLAPADQRLFRASQEGVLEAERIRSASGRWPGVEALARAGVPPFAPDPIDRAGYTWQRVETGPKVDYIGVPRTGAGREAFFIVLVEPDPGTPKDPFAVTDETHHRLGDGTMIHVTFWMGPPLADTSEAVSLLPPERGYRQVLVGASMPAR
jgi:hypothetical protein